MDNREAFDKVAGEYDQLYAGRPETDPEDDLVVSYVTRHLPPSASVVDVGCGTGFFLDKLSWPAERYRGFDYSTRMLEVASFKHPNHQFEEIDALNGGWPSWRGDGPQWMVALWSLYYWTGPQGFWDRYLASAAEGAVIVTATPLLDHGASHPDLEFEIIGWTADEVRRVTEGRVSDIVPFVIGGDVVPEDQSTYMCLVIR